MKRVWTSPLLLLLLCAVLAVACMPKIQTPATAPPKPLQVIWSGSSGGFALSWTTKEISALAHSPSRVRPIAFSDTGLTILDFSQAGNAQSSNCDFQRLSSVLSLVGPYLSLEHADEMRCGDALTATRRTQALAIDLRAPRKRPLLSDLFPQRPLLVALLQTAPVSVSLAATHAPSPHSVGDLMRVLTTATTICDAGFPKDLLNRFAFQRVRRKQVLVRIGLPLDCRASQLGLWLPIPPLLEQPLTLAATRKVGFLLADQPAIAKGRATTVLYHVRTSSGSQ